MGRIPQSQEKQYLKTYGEVYGHFLSEEWTWGLALPSSDRSMVLCNLWFVSTLQDQRCSEFLTVSCFKADSPPFLQCHDKIRPRLRHESLQWGPLWGIAHSGQHSGSGPDSLMLGLGHFPKATIMLCCSGFIYCHFLKADTSFSNDEGRIEIRCREGLAHQPSHCALPHLTSLSKESMQVFSCFMQTENACSWWQWETPQLLKHGVSRLRSSGVVKGWRKIIAWVKVSLN